MFPAGYKYFSVIDLVSSYHQLELDEKSRQFTVFNNPLGLRRHKVVPYGLLVAPQLFHNALRVGCQDQKDVLTAMDDSLVRGKQFVVVSAFGPTITARSDQKVITRNASFFKKFVMEPYDSDAEEQPLPAVADQQPLPQPLQPVRGHRGARGAVADPPRRSPVRQAGLPVNISRDYIVEGSTGSRQGRP